MSLEIYGIYDTYLGETDAGGTGHQVTLDSGGYQASRFGIRGYSQISSKPGAPRITYTLENGFMADTGALADSSRIFNRQAWIGVAWKQGEVRFGRENSPLFEMLNKMDPYFGATYASYLNNVALYIPRYDNMVTYRSPSLKGWILQAHVSLGEGNTKTYSIDSLNTYIAAVEYYSPSGKLYVGSNYAQQNSANRRFATRSGFTGGYYDAGWGKFYFGYFHGNTPTASASTNVYGPYYDLFSPSAIFPITSKLKLGGGCGWSHEETASQSNIREGSLIATYDFAKWGMVYSTANYMTNDNKAAFALGAAAPITKNVPAAGHNVGGIQLGIRFMFSAQLLKPASEKH